MFLHTYQEAYEASVCLELTFHLPPDRSSCCRFVSDRTSAQNLRISVSSEMF